ncbi:MAG: transposase, partial [Evtepia sp.]
MLKQRKSVRLRGYDYSQNGAYFITICTKNREWLFGNVGAGFARPNLSWQGKIIETFIYQIPKKYPTTIVEHSVIMPNHVHMILLLSKQGR